MHATRKHAKTLVKDQGLLSHGADDRDRTDDLILTKDVLYRLSYVSKLVAGTGFEPVTSGL